MSKPIHGTANARHLVSCDPFLAQPFAATPHQRGRASHPEPRPGSAFGI
jgi:hypothetical protein